MAFYLSNEQVNQLTKVAVDAGLHNPGMRDLLLNGIKVGFSANLPVFPSPQLQIQSDIIQMNKVDFLKGGEVPLRTWLENGLAQLRLTEQAEQSEAVFQEMLGIVAAESQRRIAAAGQTPPGRGEERPGGLEQIIHQDDLLSFGWLQGALAVGNSVARVVVPRFDNGKPVSLPGGLRWEAKGTGWLIGKQYLITNHHVVNARSDGEADASEADLRLQAAKTRVEFAYDKEDATPTLAEVEELAAWSPRYQAPILDFAILKLKQPSERAPLTLAPSSLRLLADNQMPVNIVQHPKGNPKMIGVRNNLVASLEDLELRYFTDTERGSSGSPVCDDGWRVVALHRANVYLDKNVSFQGKDTAWANRGVRIDRIVDHVKTKYPDLWAAIGAQVV